jgi:phosphoglycolate phosphatase-like HAD superfamily hydrolase
MKKRDILKSDIRILLWDIDGTLLMAPQNGSYKNYFAPALEKTFGTYGKLYEMMQVSGMTDLQIAFEALQAEGFTADDIHREKEEFCSFLGFEIEQRCLHHSERFITLPGVKEVLQITDGHPRFINSLLTGNLMPAARFKLNFVKLSQFFDFSIGAFGEISHRRQDLPGVASQRASEKFGYQFEPTQFIVIGDTPNDIDCARFFGAKAIAVATGRNHPLETLLPHNPDFLFENLQDTGKIMQVLENL